MGPIKPRRNDPVPKAESWGLPEFFVAAQVVGPAILFLPGTQSLRVLLRMSVFALGLLGLCVGCRRPATARHPAGLLLLLAISYMMLMVLHPRTNTIGSGLAQVGLNLAEIAPLFWAPRYFRGDSRRLARILTILWVSNAASAVVGIQQVRDPRGWMPAEFSSVAMSGRHGLATYQYKADDGRTVVRPPGLGDTPGSACNAGLVLGSMGLAYLALPVSATWKALGIAGSILGVTVIFLTHVRSTLIVLVGSAIVLLGLLIAQRRYATAILLFAVTALSGLTAVGYAAALGGRSTVARFATLLEDDPRTVLDRSSRLTMTAGAFDTYLVEYPMGAGLGRHGMMRQYFGDEADSNSPPLWAEVQFAAWALDGGIVLLVLWPAALMVAIWRLLRLALLDPSRTTRQWAATVLMLSISPLALLISYCPFEAQIGMQFWFLVGAMEGVALGPIPTGRADPSKALDSSFDHFKGIPNRTSTDWR